MILLRPPGDLSVLELSNILKMSVLRKAVSVGGIHCRLDPTLTLFAAAPLLTYQGLAGVWISIVQNHVLDILKAYNWNNSVWHYKFKQLKHLSFGTSQYFKRLQDTDETLTDAQTVTCLCVYNVFLKTRILWTFLFAMGTYFVTS